MPCGALPWPPRSLALALGRYDTRPRIQMSNSRTVGSSPIYGALALAVTTAFVLTLPGLADRLSPTMADFVVSAGPPFVGATLSVFLVRLITGSTHREGLVRFGVSAVFAGWFGAIALLIISVRRVVGPPGPESFSPNIEIVLGTVLGLPFALLAIVAIWMFDSIPRDRIPSP